MNSDHCYTAQFPIEAIRGTRHSIFDDARRVWLGEKLIYSEFTQDFINHDRSLPIVIDTE